MRILIAAVGSRGDVAPLTGLGTALRGVGHDVTVAALGMFEELVTACGLGFRLHPGDPQLLHASQQGQRCQEHGTGPASAIRFTPAAVVHQSRGPRRHNGQRPPRGVNQWRTLLQPLKTGCEGIRPAAPITTAGTRP